MRVGDEVRFRVRSINFTQVTTTAKGRIATTNTSEATSVIMSDERIQNISNPTTQPLPFAQLEDGSVTRKRSSSVDLSNEEELPAAMQIVGCCNEDGLGLLSWW